MPFWKTPWFAALVIAVATLVAYANSYRVPFVFDDELAIVSNPTIRSLHTALFPPHADEMGGLPISGRPVVNLSVALNYAMSGLDVRSYHVVNILVHLAGGLVLFGIVRRTLLQPALANRFGEHASELALLAAVVWTVHPLQTESVTYISQRAEALLGLFYLLTVWCFIRATETGASRKWSRWAVVACLLGMATKEVMISAPIFVALYARAFLAGSWTDVWKRHRNLLLALASTWVLLAFFVIQEGGARGLSAGFGLGVTAWDYLLTQCEAIVLYLKLSLWPHPLVLDYGTHIVRSVAEVWWQGVLLLGLLGATMWALARKPILALLGAWFFLILAPSSSVIPLVGQTIAEHRMYLPLVAVVVAVVCGGYFFLGRKTLPVFAIVAAVLGFVTLKRNEDYATSIRICEDTVAKRPDNARAMALLADYYHRAGQLDAARRSLERSLQVEPGVVAVLNNLGNVWQELNEPAKALACFQQAVALKPRDVNARNNLGNALIMSGRAPDGFEQLEAAVKLAPNSAPTRANLANALAHTGHFKEAAAQFEALLKLTPDDALSHARYGSVLLSLERRAEGVAQLETAVQLQPNDPELHHQLGLALGRMGRVREALGQFETTLQLNPNHASARQNASVARRMLGIE